MNGPGITSRSLALNFPTPAALRPPRLMTPRLRAFDHLRLPLAYLRSWSHRRATLRACQHPAWQPSGARSVAGGCLKISNGWGSQKGVRSRPVLAGKPPRSAGRYCIRLSRVFTRAVSWARLRLARLASERLRCDQASPAGRRSFLRPGAGRPDQDSAEQADHLTGDPAAPCAGMPMSGLDIAVLWAGARVNSS